MLCDIFQKALCGDFRQGRDLMLMSHLQAGPVSLDLGSWHFTDSLNSLKEWIRFARILLDSWLCPPPRLDCTLYR